MDFKLRDDMSSEDVVKAYNMSVKQRRTNNKLIHYSKRELQYCSTIYQHALKKNNTIPSMTDGYDCYQNALAESIT